MLVFLFIYICIFSIRIGKPQTTNTDGTGYEGQSLTGNNEDNILKDQLERTNHIDDDQL